MLESLIIVAPTVIWGCVLLAAMGGTRAKRRRQRCAWRAKVDAWQCTTVLRDWLHGGAPLHLKEGGGGMAVHDCA